MELADIKAYGSMRIKVDGKDEWHKADILKVEGKNISIELPEMLKNFSISQGVRCAIGDERNSYIFSGEIFDVIFRFPQSLVIYVPGNIKRFSEFRREKRYKTQYLAEVFKLRRQFGCIKDISTGGMCMFSNAHLEIGDIVGVRFFHNEGEEDYIYFSGIIAWKKTTKMTYAYGIEIVEIDEYHEDKYFGLIEELNSIQSG